MSSSMIGCYGPSLLLKLVLFELLKDWQLHRSCSGTLCSASTWLQSMFGSGVRKAAERLTWGTSWTVRLAASSKIVRHHRPPRLRKSHPSLSGLVQGEPCICFGSDTQSCNPYSCVGHSEAPQHVQWMARSFTRKLWDRLCACGCLCVLLAASESVLQQQHFPSHSVCLIAPIRSSLPNSMWICAARSKELHTSWCITTRMFTRMWRWMASLWVNEATQQAIQVAFSDRGLNVTALPAALRPAAALGESFNAQVVMHIYPDCVCASCDEILSFHCGHPLGPCPYILWGGAAGHWLQCGCKSEPELVSFPWKRKIQVFLGVKDVPCTSVSGTQAWPLKPFQDCIHTVHVVVGNWPVCKLLVWN